MSIRDIALMGNPILAKPAEAVADPRAAETHELVADMLDTMARAGGIGLAAPQIGVGKRIIIFHPPPDTPERPQSLDGIDVRVLINPVLQVLEPDAPMPEDWEACLSVPGLKGLVPRHERIRYQGVDLEGRPIDVTATHFHARVVQHEFDHLEGILYPWRLTDLAKLRYIQDWDPLSEADAFNEV